MDALSLLVSNIHLSDTKFYYLVGNGNWSYILTRQDTIVFYLVVKGGFCINIKGENNKAHTGDIIMISNTPTHKAYALDCSDTVPQPIHELLENGISERININQESNDCNAELVLIECSYDKELMRPLLSALPSLLPERNTEAPASSQLLDMAVDVLKMESTADRMGKSAVINRLASIIMIDCLRTYIESLPEATESWLLALRDPYLAKALAIMHREPNHHWTISQLAEVAGMSRSSFAERFKQIVGTPPLTYLIDYRMRLAAQYLRLQQHSISQISDLVGYASDSTFSQAFKRAYGISPRGYRQRYVA